MTIEIRQLVIRATVHPSPDASTSPTGAAIAASSPGMAAPDASAAQDALLDNLVATCVRTVLRRLERSRER
jgi:hypothetical protein